jgi:hypothetical protein
LDFTKFNNYLLFFYPIGLSCLNFSWQTKSIEDIIGSIKTYNSFIFNSFLNFIPEYQLLFIGLIAIILVLIMNFKKFLNLLFLKRKAILLTLSLIFVFFVFYLEPLKLIIHLVQSNQNVLLKTIYIKEIIFLILFYSLGIVFVVLTFKEDISMNKFSDINFSIFSPFLFFMISFLIWILLSPNPRLGQNIFLLLIPAIIILLINLKKTTVYDFSKYFNLLLIIVLLKISIFQNFAQINISSIIFVKKSAPKVKLDKREFFGYSAQNTEHFCWTEKDCYPYNDVKIYKELLNYKFFKEIKN